MAQSPVPAAPGRPDLRLVLGGHARLSVEIDRQAPVPLADQIASRLAELIRAGTLPHGTRLPSIRALAGRAGIGVHSVVEAYARLAAMGLAVSRSGSGVYAIRPAELPPAPPLPRPDPTAAEGIALAMLEAREDVLCPGGGVLPEAWTESAWQGGVLSRFHRGLPAHLRRVAPPQGGAAVREHVCQRLAMRGISVPPDGVLMTAGGTQALQLVAQTFLSPGDTVLVEDPGYFMLFPMLEQRGLHLVPVERRPDGPCLEALERACRGEAPKAFFLQPVLHNPTGWTASAANLHRLLRIAERHNLLLVEDDAHGDLHGGEPVRLMQLDGGASVIHVGSFTKLIGQGTRVGFLAASAERLQALLRTKVTTALTGSGVEEQLVLEMLCSGQYRRHLETLRARLSAARGLVAGRLRVLGFTVAGGEEGMFLWAEAPPGAREDLVLAARDHGLVLAGGTLFRPGRQPSRHFRFNIGHSTDPRIAELLGLLLKEDGA
ncbi:aminotransferase-like domain-containing protein [Pseudoroseomonas ludipueritiae]|uniref:PLP-dependent aminotransferase family protein n=1 Tax=Pseudoroseomonas ludipueritiae TaxID=198093 RepID=A0ABR7R1J6_9PROT|nr:PLP-dependent aminotransferase family protein [Pseudoroseomonas ludipueritiae]MBC9175591.1 PLP-dependent aminotransferase family protein [Pseudoroseomonas ludipueritiae]